MRLSRGSQRELVEAHFTANEVGEHVVDVHVRGEQVRGAPYRTHAYNARAIQVGRIPNGVLGQPVEFESEYRYYRSTCRIPLKLKTRTFYGPLLSKFLILNQ